MPYLDVAGSTRGEDPSGRSPIHVVAAIRRGVTISSAELDLDAGDRFDGPTAAQLLIVAESATPGADASAVRHAAESVIRALLRERQPGFAEIERRRPEGMERSLGEAVEFASQSIGGGPEDAVSLVAALVAWPAAAVASSGDGVALVCRPDLAVSLFAPQTAETVLAGRLDSTVDGGAGPTTGIASGIGGSQPCPPSSWSGTLEDEAVLLLGTSEARKGPLAQLDELPRKCQQEPTAKKLVDALLSEPGTGKASLTAARLVDGDAPLMEVARAGRTLPADNASTSAPPQDPPATDVAVAKE